MGFMRSKGRGKMGFSRSIGRGNGSTRSIWRGNGLHEINGGNISGAAAALLLLRAVAQMKQQDNCFHEISVGRGNVLYEISREEQGWFLDMAKSIFDRTLVKTGNNRQKLEKTRQKPTLFKNPQKYILDIHTKYVLLLWYVGVLTVQVLLLYYIAR